MKHGNIISKSKNTYFIIKYVNICITYIYYITDVSFEYILCGGLKGNKLIKGVLLTEGKLDPKTIKRIGNLVLISNKEIVQFPNDNGVDLCNNYNAIASDVFKELLIDIYDVELKLGFSVYSDKCVKDADLYCINTTKVDFLDGSTRKYAYCCRCRCNCCNYKYRYY